MSFLDVQIIRDDQTFTNSVCSKPTYSGVCTHFDNILPSTYKSGTIYKLAYRCLRICSSWTKSQNFLKNGLSENFLFKKIYG